MAGWMDKWWNKWTDAAKGRKKGFYGGQAKTGRTCKKSANVTNL